MAELKTKPNDASVQAYLDNITNAQRKEDCLVLHDLMKEITGEEPVMWGASIVGYSSYHYKSKTGREGDWFITGFSNRAQSLSVYIMAGFDRYEELMAKLGKYKTGKSCLYIKKLADVDRDVLRELIQESVDYMNEIYKG